MKDDRYDIATISTNIELSIDDIVEWIQGIIGGEAKAFHKLLYDWGTIKVVKQNTYDPAKSETDEFYYYKYLLEISSSKEGVPDSRIPKTVVLLLTALWDQGCKAVFMGDYDDYHGDITSYSE